MFIRRDTDHATYDVHVDSERPAINMKFFVFMGLEEVSELFVNRIKKLRAKAQYKQSTRYKHTGPKPSRFDHAYKPWLY